MSDRGTIKFILASIGLSIFVMCIPCTAANISVVPNKDGEADLIILKGEITVEDEKAFSQIALNSKAATVLLDSPGGRLLPAMAIGKVIRIKQFSTAVIDSDCMSSCALIWLAGQNRYLAKNSRVGFHAAYIQDSSGAKTPATTGNALVGSYLNALGFNESIITFATKAGIGEINWMHKEEADRLGLAVSILDNKHKAVAIFDRALKNKSDNKVDFEETAKIYRSSADAGFSGAQNNLGDMYELGQGVPKNKEFAIYWYTRAAERGEPTAYLSLSTILSEGSTDPQVLIEALKYAVLAIYKLPEGFNMAVAKQTARKVLGMLSAPDISRAIELAREWDPLYQEKYLMSDTPGHFAITSMPASQPGNARSINLRKIIRQDVSLGYTRPMSGQGSWILIKRGTAPIGGKVTLLTGVARPQRENGNELLEVEDEVALYGDNNDKKSALVKTVVVTLIDSSDFRARRTIDEESSTEYEFNVVAKDSMRIDERVRVGTLTTRDKGGLVTESGTVFEELRMSLEIFGALEYCQVEHVTSTSTPITEKLSHSCDIFREGEVALGQVMEIAEDNGTSTYKVSVKYDISKN